ncbi:MAG: HAD-IB family phosphatase [Candidatus Thermoplasmatota archaeon]|nr:HAD-IB family phosphatase [Candidatus Thermoplasmatota archaeon]
MVIKLVAFDMDGVLTKHASSWRFVHDVLGVNNNHNLKRYREGLISYQDFLNSDIELWVEKFPGIRKIDIMQILSSVPIRDDISQAISLLRSAGAMVVIISGGISWLTDILNEKAEFDQRYANEILTDSDGLILPEGKVVVDPKRKDAILRYVQEELNIDRDETASVGDSNLDTAMFDLSSLGIFFSYNDLSGDQMPPSSDIIEKTADVCIRSGRLMDIYRYIFMK